MTAVTFATSLITPIQAQSEGTNKKEYKLPGFQGGIPTGIEINPRDKDENGREVQNLRDGVSGPQFQAPNVKLGLTGQFLGQFGDIDDAMRGDVYIMGSVSLGDLAVELGVSLEDLINELLDDEWEVNRARSNGITSSLPKDILNKLRVVITPFRYVKDGKTMFALTLIGGRDAATPLGTTVQPEWAVDLSTLINRELGEQDLIKVRAEIAEVVFVEVVNYGYDVFGYHSDAKDFIEPSGDGDSFAINVGASWGNFAGEGNAFSIWYSYADTSEGVFYTRALQADQPGENQTHAAGLKMKIEQFTLAAEGYLMQRDNVDDEFGGEIRAQYELDRFIPYVGLGFRDDGSKTDLIYRAGVGYRIASNVMASVGLEFVDPDTGDSSTNFYAGVTIMENLHPLKAADKKEG